LFVINRFYIILQGSVNIYRLDDDSPKAIELDFDTVTEFPKFDVEPDKREQFIAQAFGNYIVTLSRINRKFDDISKILKFLAGGFDFGERALITNEPRSATVMTATPTDLLVVDRVVFSRFVIKIFIIISF